MLGFPSLPAARARPANAPVQNEAKLGQARRPGGLCLPARGAAHYDRRVMDPSLPRTRAIIEAGIAAGLHIGAQLYVSRDGRPLADLAFGQARPGVPMT